MPAVPQEQFSDHAETQPEIGTYRAEACLDESILQCERLMHFSLRQMADPIGFDYGAGREPRRHAIDLPEQPRKAKLISKSGSEGTLSRAGGARKQNESARISVAHSSIQ